MVCLGFCGTVTWVSEEPCSTLLDEPALLALFALGTSQLLLYIWKGSRKYTISPIQQSRDQLQDLIFLRICAIKCDKMQHVISHQLPVHHVLGFSLLQEPEGFREMVVQDDGLVSLFS